MSNRYLETRDPTNQTLEVATMIRVPSKVQNQLMWL